MSRTYRRRGQRHDYRWVLPNFHWINGVLIPFQVGIPTRTKGAARSPVFIRTPARQCEAPRRAGTAASSITIAAR
jgi:hypothetical protein